MRKSRGTRQQLLSLTEDRPTTAEALQEAIRAGGLSQRELARKAGLDEAMVSRLVHGTRTPSVDTIDRILDALGMEIVIRTRRHARKGE